MTKMGRRPAGRLIGLALVLALTATAARGAASQVEISFADGRLTLQAEQVPLRAVLEAVAEATGFSIELRGAFAETVSPSIRDRPIHSAIGKLLDAGGHSFILQRTTYGSVQSGRLLVIAANGGGVSAVATAERSDEPLDPEGEAIEEAVVILEEMRLTEDVALREAAAEALADLDEMAAAN